MGRETRRSETTIKEEEKGEET